MQDTTWKDNGLTEDHLKEFIEYRNWTAVTLSKTNNKAYYKKVQNGLKPDRLRPNPYSKGIWVRE